MVLYCYKRMCADVYLFFKKKMSQARMVAHTYTSGIMERDKENHCRAGSWPA